MRFVGYAASVLLLCATVWAAPAQSGLRPHMRKWDAHADLRSQLRPLIIHPIGYGAQEQDALFDWQINGHFRYFRGLTASRIGQPGRHADS